ncbi:hypothetical protein MCG44_00185 [Lawsonibacter sp. OA9]|uniref:putative ABC transporter permease subunit n=1 Tax=Oscillospiraceae TaxID=216572 RepID=UPI001F06C642|nr:MULTISPECIES: hypothetical protein [Oscillospiraceae]MCH1978174.1 hypothetical protein [Lawsonibacter sp. OA9]MCH1983721.1 hypothetical protein [Ruminococcus sp. OA3]
MFKALIKMNLRQMFSAMFQRSRNKKSSALLTVGIVLLAIYVVGCLFLLFGMLFGALCLPLTKAGLDWLYFAVMGIVGILLSFIGSVMMTKSQLYDAKDNELLLSMPIAPGNILAGRLLSLLLLNYVYQSFVMIPAGVIYGIMVGFSVTQEISFIVVFLLLPFISLTLSCILGWVLAVVSSRIPMRHIVSLIIFVAFMGGYFYVYSKITVYMQWLLNHGADLAEAVRKSLFPIYHLGVAVGEGNLLSLLLFMLCTIIPAVVVAVVLTKSFIHIATTKHSQAKVKYKEGALKTGGIRNALFKKELSRFGTNSMYMMNAAIGSIFTLLLTAAAVIKWKDIMPYVQKIPEQYYGVAGAMVLAGLLSMNFISAPSISVEGKNLWIAKTLPVPTIELLLAKVKLHVVVGEVPSIAAGILLNVLLPMDILSRIMIFLLPFCFNVTIGFLGIVLNLRFPKLDWVNETAAVKQGLSPFLSMILAMVFIAAPAAGYIALFVMGMSCGFFMAVHCMILAAASAGMYFYLKENGSRRFMEL